MSASARTRFAGKAALVTGAAGTIGRALVAALLDAGVSRLVALDNNETEIFFLECEARQDERLNAIVGDVRDGDKLQHLMAGIEIVFHAAALKHVTVCERAPFDAVQTNIWGVKNVVNAALANQVERVVFTSSDKAVNPTNVMGTSKLMGERLITAANSLVKGQRTVFTSTRFGNVIGSRGSVLAVFEEQIRAGGPVTLTDERMTRFIMSPRQAVELVLDSTYLAHGGEVFVTKMPTVAIADFARAAITLLAPRHGLDPAAIEVELTGIRPGEKLYEELLSEEETRRTVEIPRYFVILPAFPYIYSQIDYHYVDAVGPVGDRIYRSDRETPLDEAEIRAFLLDEGLIEGAVAEQRGETQ